MADQVINTDGNKQYDVTVENLVKKFKDVVAVDNISFGIEKGHFFSLLGPSGCGKTTTLRALAGFVEPDGGTVMIGGKKMNNVPPYLRPTNMVFQRLALFPHLTVADNITFGLRLKKTPKPEMKSRLQEVLALIGMETYGERRVYELSGGQQQRVAIARAVINRPQVLLLDEPLGSLDLQLRLQMQIELKRIQNTLGTTFVYVTHDQGEAMTMSNDIAIMNNGKIVQLGSPKEIYEKPNTSFVAKFIGESNLISGEITALDKATGKIHIGGGIEFWGTSAAELTTGQKINVCIRPERIVIGDDVSYTDNKLQGVIEEAIYYGPHTQYHIIVRGEAFEAKLFVRINNASESGLLPKGETVQVGWNVSDAILLE